MFSSSEQKPIDSVDVLSIRTIKMHKILLSNKFIEFSFRIAHLIELFEMLLYNIFTLNSS